MQREGLRYAAMDSVRHGIAGLGSVHEFLKMRKAATRWSAARKSKRASLDQGGQLFRRRSQARIGSVRQPPPRRRHGRPRESLRSRRGRLPTRPGQEVVARRESLRRCRASVSDAWTPRAPAVVARLAFHRNALQSPAWRVRHGFRTGCAGSNRRFTSSRFAFGRANRSWQIRPLGRPAVRCLRDSINGRFSRRSRCPTTCMCWQHHVIATLPSQRSQSGSSVGLTKHTAAIVGRLCQTAARGQTRHGSGRKAVSIACSGPMNRCLTSGNTCVRTPCGPAWCKILKIGHTSSPSMQRTRNCRASVSDAFARGNHPAWWRFTETPYNRYNRSYTRLRTPRCLACGQRG